MSVMGLVFFLRYARPNIMQFIEKITLRLVNACGYFWKRCVSSARMVKNDIVSEILLTEKINCVIVINKSRWYQDIWPKFYDIWYVHFSCSIEKYLYSTCHQVLIFQCSYTQCELTKEFQYCNRLKL